ncbi:MAG TPA: hypothetical protein VFY36_04175 [Solirubrobacteraceae bacterium]|nr:hypothetical protein [Solirubrobacteraceae bacterium]
MTARDRIVLMTVIVVAVLGAGWMLVVSPERKKASSVSAEVTSAQAALSAAEGELSKARAAQSQYAAAYSSIVSLGKAVPAEKEVPSLIYQLARATRQRNVFFSSISSTDGAAGASPASSAEATAVAAGFTAMPFSFVLGGSFFDLERLMHKLTDLTTRTAAGTLKVNGRLLTIQGVSLTPANKSGAGTSNELTGTVTASAYVLPGDEPAAAGGTAASSAGASTPASTTGAPSSPTAPATVTVNP